MKKLCNLALALLLVLSLGMVAMAADANPTVIFDGGSKAFTFENVAQRANASGDAVPDLFPGMKDVMPGDALTQTVDVQIKNVQQYDTVKLYLRADDSDEAYQKLLEQMTLTVSRDGEDLTASLGENLLLGSFTGNAAQALDVTLNLPVEADNEIAGLEAKLNWIFTAEIITNLPPVVPPVVTTATPAPTARPWFPWVRPTATPDATATPAVTATPAPEATPEATPEPTKAPVSLGDEDVPLVAPAEGGAWALVNLILTVLTAACGVLMLIGYFTGKKAEEDQQIKKKGVFRLVSAAWAVLTVVVFIFTEDMTQPMVLLDKWTIAMVLLAVVQIAWMLLCHKKVEDAE